MYIFVHIPKTAGTSFRLSAADYFGKNKIVGHYNKESNATSQVVKNFWYESNDKKLYKEMLQKKEKKFITGHICLDDYYEFIPEAKYVTFLRDPLQRVISSYNVSRRRGLPEL